jgi:hypothetical protein
LRLALQIADIGWPETGQVNRDHVASSAAAAGRG